MVQDSQKQKLQLYQQDFENIKKEFSKIIVGQDETLRKLLIALICKGHVLVEGVPGIAKTLIVKTLAKISGCEFSRVQFTPDLLPGDITGVETYDAINKFYIVKGPIFANFVLADEINRASPKVQSALLESMQEKQATIGRETYSLPQPFFVMATQNPLESVGVYNLPEAQVDRFLFKLIMTYPERDEEELVLSKNINIREFNSYNIKSVINKNRIMEIQNQLDDIYMDENIKKYIVDIIDATRNTKNYRIESGQVEFGCSPRGSIGMYMASKANALISNRTFVTPDDVKKIAHDVLRHRIILSYESQADGVKTENVLNEILNKVPVP